MLYISCGTIVFLMLSTCTNLIVNVLQYKWLISSRNCDEVFDEIFSIIVGIASSLNAIAYILAVFVYFTRLIITFEDTAWKISKNIKTFFYLSILYVIYISI